jgi:flagellar hook assembly protein FlgD
VLDGDEQHPYILNDYYETESGTYQRGHASFPVSGLPDGLHTFTVKAWDAYNNSGTGSVRFVVGNGKVMQVQNLMNYPNPFKEETHFFFEQNHPTDVLKVQIAVYDMAGKRVRLLETSSTPGGSHSGITWDGTTDNGVRLQSGVYPYRMILTTPTGIQTTAYQKLVIVR